MSRALSTTEKLRVYAKPNPLASDISFAEFKPRTSITKILGRLVDQPDLAVSVNGEAVPREQWATTRPGAGDLVLIVKLPRDFGISATVSAIATVVTQAAATAGIVTTLTGAATFAGVVSGIATVVVYAGISMALQALSALIQPQPPKAPNGLGSLNSRFAQLSGVQNQANPYGVLPKVYGRFRFVPPAAGRIYSHTKANNQYLHVLLCLTAGSISIDGRIVGAGGVSRITNQDGPEQVTLARDTIRIGETDIGQFGPVDWEICTPDRLSLYSGDVDEQSFSLSFPHNQPPGVEGQWITNNQAITRTTGDNAQTISMDLAAAALISFSKTGAGRPVKVEWTVRYRPAGTDDPFVFFSNASAANPWVVEAQSRTGVRVSRDFKLPSRGKWDIRLQRVRTFIIDSESVQAEMFWTALRSIDRTRPAWNSNPVAGGTPNVVMMALQIKATGKLNGTIDPISVLGIGVARVWNGSAWVWQATQNPAWHYVDVLTGTHLQKPLPDSGLRLSELADWANWCAATSTTYNWYHTNEESILDRLKAIATTGRAAWHILDSKFTVVRDNKFAAVQVLSPRNTRSISLRRIYPTIPHALRVRYVDSTEYQPAERIVLADGYQLNGVDAWGNAAPGLPAATEFEVFETQGVDNPAQAFREGRYFLAQAILRPETYTVEMDIAHLVAVRGDCVRINQDTIQTGLGGARIVEVTPDVNGFADWVRLDERKTMEAGQSYAFRAMLMTGQELFCPLVTIPGENDVFHLAVAGLAIAGPGGLEPDVHVAFGIAGKETILVKISDIRAHADMTATLTCIPAAPEILGADTGVIPPFDPVITIPPEDRSPPVPIILLVAAGGDRLTLLANGEWASSVFVQWTQPPSAVLLESFEVLYYGPGLDARSILISANFFQAEIPGLPLGLLLSVQVRALSKWGKWSDYSAPYQITTTSEAQLNAAPPTNLALSTRVDVRLDGTVDAFIRATWTPPDGVVLSNYDVQFQREGGNWESRQIDKTATSFEFLATLGATYGFRIRSATIRGVSDWVGGLIVAAVKDQPPGPPTNLLAEGGYNTITFRWLAPADLDLGAIELWTSADNNRNNAIQVWSGYTAPGKQGEAVLSVPGGTTRFGWVRALDTSGNESAWHPAGLTAGVSGRALDAWDSGLTTKSPALYNGFEGSDFNRWEVAGPGALAPSTFSYAGQQSGYFVSPPGFDTYVFLPLPADWLTLMAGRRVVILARISGGGPTPSTQCSGGLFVPAGGGVNINLPLPGGWQEFRIVMTLPVNNAGAFVYFRTEPFGSQLGRGIAIDAVSLFLFPEQINADNIDQYIGTAAIGDLYVANVSATKLTTGTLTASTIFVGDNASIHISGPGKYIATYDQQTPQRLRVLMGRGGANPEDYGFWIWDQNGNNVINANGLGLSVVGTLQVNGRSINVHRYGAAFNVQVWNDAGSVQALTIPIEATPAGTRGGNMLHVVANIDNNAGATTNEYQIRVDRSDGVLIESGSGNRIRIPPGGSASTAWVFYDGFPPAGAFNYIISVRQIGSNAVGDVRVRASVIEAKDNR